MDIQFECPGALNQMLIGQLIRNLFAGTASFDGYNLCRLIATDWTKALIVYMTRSEPRWRRLTRLALPKVIGCGAASYDAEAVGSVQYSKTC